MAPAPALTLDNLTNCKHHTELTKKYDSIVSFAITANISRGQNYFVALTLNAVALSTSENCDNG